MVRLSNRVLLVSLLGLTMAMGACRKTYLTPTILIDYQIGDPNNVTITNTGGGGTVVWHLQVVSNPNGGFDVLMPDGKWYYFATEADFLDWLKDNGTHIFAGSTLADIAAVAAWVDDQNFW